VIYGTNYGFIKEGKMISSDAVSCRGYLNEDWSWFPFFFWTSSTCCRRQVLNRIGGFDERMMYGEDCDVWFRLLLVGKGQLIRPCRPIIIKMWIILLHDIRCRLKNIFHIISTSMLMPEGRMLLFESSLMNRWFIGYILICLIKI
jgi:hypothetical protein